MTFHILTGDSLATTFKRADINGMPIISRECFIVGPVNGETEEIFWEERANYCVDAFGEQKENYYSFVKGEFDHIDEIGPDDEVCLWFENDLFCQTNMWFVVSLLNKRRVSKIYRVCPLIRSERKWDGFGQHTAKDLRDCYSQKALFTKGDFNLGTNLWDAYKSQDLVAMAFHSKSLSPCFPCLEEVCRAEIERKTFGRPQKALEDIMAKGYTSFDDIFTQFNKREAIYGFGDMQVDNMLKDMRV